MNKFIHELFEWLSIPLIRLGRLWLDIGDFIFLAVSLFLLFYVSERLRRWIIERLLGRTRIDIGIRQSIGQLFKYGLVGLGFLLIMHSLGVELTALGVALGTLGVGIGVGLQSVADNFVSGVVILLERPIRVGDRITVGQVNGDVTEIRSRATKVITNDNIAIIVPNAEFISKKVTNWSLNGGASRFNLPIQICFEEDPEYVRQLLLEVLKEEKGILKIPAPDVLFESFDNGVIELNIRVWSSQFTHKPPVLENRIYSAVAEKLRQHNVKVPYPQIDLHWKEPNLDLQDY